MASKLNDVYTVHLHLQCSKFTCLTCTLLESEGLDSFTVRCHSGTESDEEVQSKARAKTRARRGTGKTKGRM